MRGEFPTMGERILQRSKVVTAGRLRGHYKKKAEGADAARSIDGNLITWTPAEKSAPHG
jgi:hypothetical protein